ncbi:MAG: phosphatidylglycerophosphatase A [Legionellaceae bacterium]|nr:phosphatidylglycerophosphatase A [Legionellaceae bacterium]
MNILTSIKKHSSSWFHEQQPIAKEPSESIQIKQCLLKVWQDPAYFIAFGFGSGLMPRAPGTWGTVAAIPIYLLIAHTSPSVYILLTVLAFVLGVAVCHRVSRELGVNDYKGIVWDEVVGYLLTMMFAPVGLTWILAGFLLFRLFDIWKPQPIRWIDQRVKGGLGIMLDDVIAAIPAWMVLRVLIWIFE